LWKVLKGEWFYSLPVIVLLYTLAVIDLPIQHVGMYTALTSVVVIVLAMQAQRTSRKSAREVGVWLRDCVDSTGRSLVMPAVATAAELARMREEVRTEVTAAIAAARALPDTTYDNMMRGVFSADYQEIAGATTSRGIVGKGR
jgi:TRAP-type uncharacterized transport system fused permease subunit